MLYLDEKYDENLEKELQELNDETGEVSAVELTNVSASELNEKSDQLEEGDEIIKLKIRRRRKIVKAGPQSQEPEKETA